MIAPAWHVLSRQGGLQYSAHAGHCSTVWPTTPRCAVCAAGREPRKCPMNRCFRVPLASSPMLSSPSAYTPRSSNAPSRNGWWATFCATAPRLKRAKRPRRSQRRRRIRARAGYIARLVATKRPEQMTRIERQASGAMTLAEMMAELPRACNVAASPTAKASANTGPDTNCTWTWPMGRSRSVAC